MKNRKGKINIDRRMLNGEMKEVLSLFSLLIPRYIEDNPMNSFVSYYCLSPMFKELHEGDSVPLYDAIATYEKDGTMSVQFKIVG